MFSMQAQGGHARNKSPSSTRSSIDSACSRTCRSHASASPRWTCPTPLPRDATPSTRSSARRAGIMRRLNDEELEAVLAHELSHVAHRDVAIMTIASGVGMLAGLVGRIALFGDDVRRAAAAVATGRTSSSSSWPTFVLSIVDLHRRLLAHDGALSLPRARGRPLGGDPHRQAERARERARARDRRHGQDPAHRPAQGRRHERLLLRPGARRRHRGRRSSRRTRRSRSDWTS